MPLIKKSVILTFVLTGAAIGASLFWRADEKEFKKTEFSGEEEEAAYVLSEMKICYGRGGRDGCYRTVSEKILNRLSLERVLDIFQKNETRPEIFSRCHEATHFLARKEYKRVQDLKEIFSVCTAVCHGGCYHGAMESYFAQKNLPIQNPGDPAIEKEIQNACGAPSKNQKPNVYTECLHGIGHAVMFITDGDIFKSLALCDKLGLISEKETCYGGVFMENSSSSTNNDHPGKFIRKDDPLYPCSALDERYLQQCFAYQSSHFAIISKHNWAKTAELCRTVPEKYRRGCFEIIGTNQVGFTQDMSIMKKNCGTIREPEFKDACIRGVVISLTGRYHDDPERIIPFCPIVDPENKKSCYEQIDSSLLGWFSDETEKNQYCALLKEPSYSNLCQIK